MKMTEYCVVKLLEGHSIYGVETTVVGDVELRPSTCDFDEELQALSSSIKNSGYEANPKFVSRICTIVSAPNLEIAERLSDEKFIEVLDVFGADVPTSKMKLSNCGYIKDLDAGTIFPIEKLKILPSTAFKCSQGPFKQIEFSHWVLNQTSDLALRYRRSLHWSNNSRWEKNLQLGILYQWFAVEALFKESEQDHVGPYIRWFLGYPNGQSAQYVSQKLLKQLESKPEYNKWKKWVIDSVEAIREIRNDSVHNGFRGVDFEASDLLKYSELMTYGCSRCQGAVRTALGSGLKTVPEFNEFKSVIFESNDNLVNDVHGNILFSLERGGLSHMQSNIYG